jgi:hypothetical protein
MKVENPSLTVGGAGIGREAQPELANSAARQIEDGHAVVWFRSVRSSAWVSGVSWPGKAEIADPLRL